MPRILILLIYIIPFTSNSQDIKYQLILKDPCNGEHEYSLLHQLIKNDSVFNIQDTLGTIYLTEIGKYQLDASLYLFNQEIYILEGLNIDTLTTPTINECLEPVSHPKFIGYCCCGDKCDGIKKDYYNNGQLRISGTFKSGHPVGELIQYYKNGQIKEIRVYDKRGKGIIKRKIKYDQEGNDVQ